MANPKLRLPTNASYDAAKEAAAHIAEEAGGRFVSGYSDPEVIAGQASVITEVLAQLDGAFQIVVPVGGGGLASGIALGAPERVSVIGVESEHSHAVSTAMAEGRNVQVNIGATITDGTAGNIAYHAFTPQILREHAVAMVRAQESAVRSAVRDRTTASSEKEQQLWVWLGPLRVPYLQTCPQSLSSQAGI